MKPSKTIKNSMPLKPIALGVIAALATGCATTQPSTASNSADAQSALGDAMAGQLRRSFDYTTDVYVSNAIREDALANASDAQKQASEDKSAVCEDEHDRAYIALTKKLMAEQGKKAEDITVGDEHEAIKQAYKDCLDARGDLTGLKEFDFEAFFDKTADMDAESQFDLLYQEMQAFDQTESASNDDTEYDSDHTALDAKKAELAKAYLIEPTTVQIKGRYQPLAGTVSALPSISYQAKNLHMQVNQPIYVDLKQGVIYLWADNFAMINSEALDKKLGDQWRNKWLKVPINDGSLPADFSKNFLKAILDAKKQSFYSLNADAFSWVTPSMMLDTPHLSTNLSAKAIDTIAATPSIIRSQPTDDAKRFANYVFAESLYNAILDNYPELMPSMIAAERTIEDGDSHIIVSALTSSDTAVDDVPTNDADTNDETVKLNSRMMLNVLLSYLAGVIDDYLNTASQERDAPNFMPVSHYGIAHERINWIHQRQYLTNTSLKGGQLGSQPISFTQPVIVDLFTTISPSSTSPIFNRLPSNANVPTAANSVDLFEYSHDLIERLKSGDDKYLKAMLALTTGIGGEATGIDDELPLDEPVDESLPEMPHDEPVPNSDESHSH